MKRAIAVLFLLVVVVGGFFFGDSGSPDTQTILQPPSGKNYFGTDALGRGVAGRVLLASSLSLSISVMAWGCALVVGTAIGSFAGYAEGTWFSVVTDQVVGVTYATPFFIVMVAVLGLLGPGIGNAYIVLILFAWAAPARHAGIIVRNLRSATHVRAALSIGYRPGRLVRFVVLPQVFPTVTVAALAVLPEILALDVGLSFFGLGAQPPTPTFGGLLVEGLAYGTSAWWLVSMPLGMLGSICLALRALRPTN